MVFFLNRSPCKQKGNARSVSEIRMTEIFRVQRRIPESCIRRHEQPLYGILIRDS